MTSIDSDYLTPAPGRRVVHLLRRGGAAVLLQLVPDRPIAAVGLFRRGRGKDVVDEPDDAHHPARLLAPGLGTPATTYRQRPGSCSP
jgi:hypothetical protein